MEGVPAGSESGRGKKSKDCILGYSSVSKSGDEKDPAKATERGQPRRQGGNQRSVLSRKLHEFPGEGSCHVCGIAADGLRKVGPTGGAFVFIKV